LEKCKAIKKATNSYICKEVTIEPTRTWNVPSAQEICQKFFYNERGKIVWAFAARGDPVATMASG